MSNRRKATPTELEFITAAREGERDRLHDALVEMQRDPKRCSAVRLTKRPASPVFMVAVTRVLKRSQPRWSRPPPGHPRRVNQFTCAARQCVARPLPPAGTPGKRARGHVLPAPTR